MQELLRNAVDGWFAYTDAGKYGVLFLGVLLCYWYRSAPGSGQCRRWMLYASVTAAAAVFPVTAAVLMMYQTRFYDYKWIFSIVPVTPVIAFGAARLYLECYRRRWRGKFWKPAGLVAAGLAVIFLCGNLSTGGCEGENTAPKKRKTAVILDKLAQSGDTEDICMWAPGEILSHVRELDGEIRLLYGRNMWETALNAYAYDVYDQETIALYEWMESLETGNGADLTGEAKQAACVAVETALHKGVNCIVIPEEKNHAISACVAQVAEKWKYTVTLKAAEGYYIYRLRA